MKAVAKTLLALLTVVVLVLSQWNMTIKKTAAAETIKDVIIDLNIPEVDRVVENNQLQLRALKIFNEGHFTAASENLVWKSSNKTVAKVDENGLVTLTGQNGKTFITVENGTFEDRIAIQYNQNSHALPAVQIFKEKGERYDVIGHAIAKMKLEEKVGQMLMPDFRTWNGKNVTAMLPEIAQLVKEYHLGGVILFRENVVTTEQTARLVADYQAAAEKFGLLLGIDQEGGIVTRLQSGTDMPGNMALGATRSKETAWKVGHAIGEELDSLGINMNLAPVLDVNNNQDNPVIGVRSFGEDPKLVADMGIPYIGGLQKSGVAATAKHFPGHGDTAEDSHLGLPEVPHEKERLKAVELYPFQQAMDAGIDAVMTAHVTFPKIDGTKVISQKDGTEIALPATLSQKVLTGLIREEMSYKGVIITDAMNMKAITEHFGPVDAAIRSVKAGTDIVLMPVGLKEVAQGLLAAVNNGEISESRIDDSVKRILTLKLKRGIIKPETETDINEKIQHALKIVGSPEHKQVEKEAAAQSITLVKNTNVLPLQAAASDKIVVIGNTYIENLSDALKKHHDNVALIKATGPLSEQNLAQIKDAKYVVLGTYTFNVAGRAPDSAQMRLANQIVGTSEAPVIGVAIRNPYDVIAYPDIDGYLVQYGFRTASFEAVAATIFGENAPSGKLPVTIFNDKGETMYGFGHGLTY